MPSLSTFWDLQRTARLSLLTHGTCTRRRHFETLLPFFNNTNYIRIDGKPVFSIYKLRDVPEDVKGPMLAFWRRMAIENGLKGLHIVAVCAVMRA